MMKSQLMHLLSGPERLIDKFSIVSALNTDLRGKKYIKHRKASLIRGETDDGSSSTPTRGSDHSDTKRSESLVRLNSEVVELDLTDDDVTVDEQAVVVLVPESKTKKQKTSEEKLTDGFVDSDGDHVWIIEDIVAYAPHKGYKVKWLGWEEPTWNLPKDMPKGKKWADEAMAMARFKYHNTH